MSTIDWPRERRLYECSVFECYSQDEFASFNGKYVPNQMSLVKNKSDCYLNGNVALHLVSTLVKLNSDITSLNQKIILSVVLCPKSSALKQDLKSETQVI